VSWPFQTLTASTAESFKEGTHAITNSNRHRAFGTPSSPEGPFEKRFELLEVLADGVISDFLGDAFVSTLSDVPQLSDGARACSPVTGTRRNPRAADHSLGRIRHRQALQPTASVHGVDKEVGIAVLRRK
jgi:hypothetical protein